MKYFRVIAIDLLGFGKSDRPDFDFQEFHPSMQFFTWPIVQIVKLLNLKNLLIIGHSYGGLITSHLVPLIKKRVIGVWLVCPAGFNKKVFTENQKKEIYENFGNQFKVGPDLMEFISYLTFDKVTKIGLFFDFLKN
jgi:pimeloyl-ACP methyl ester carboxylesterase